MTNFENTVALKDNQQHGITESTDFTPVVIFHLAHRLPPFYAAVAEETDQNGMRGYHAVGNYTGKVEHEIRALFIPNHSIVATEYPSDPGPPADEPYVPARHEGSE